jgi:hypothetical protein
LQYEESCVYNGVVNTALNLSERIGL